MSLPLTPELPTGSHKKVIYFVRHAEALHNVKERQAMAEAAAHGADKERQEAARRAVLEGDVTLKDAPLSTDGTVQARTSGAALKSLFETVSPLADAAERRQSAGTFRRPDVVLVSPLRRALMTATELFYDPNDTNDPPMFMAVEALREKRTGYAADERSNVDELRAEFPHVDFSDVARGQPVVPLGEGNAAVRARAANFIYHRLAAVPGTTLAVVSHKGWLRELRTCLKERVTNGALRADFDVVAWEKSLFGNAEVRVAAFRWQDGELVSVVSRSVDNAKLASAAMMGDGFEFALGPPNSGFSIFLANRTTKVHFISLAEGKHHVAMREVAAASALDVLQEPDIETLLQRQPNHSPTEHELFDARLTTKGAQQAAKLRKMLATRPSGGRPFTAFDLVLVSPLTRACETAEIIFGTSPGTYGGMDIPPPRILVREECRERYGRFVCDARRTTRELATEFPNFDWAEMSDNEDVLWSDTRETATHVRERSLQLLQMLSSRPERCVAVVTHGEFLRHLFGQFVDTLADEDKCLLQRSSTTCELRSVVLCSHGPVEARVDAPSSTIRVPSSSSVSSLLNYYNE